MNLEDEREFVERERAESRALIIERQELVESGGGPMGGGALSPPKPAAHALPFTPRASFFVVHSGI